MGMRSWNTSSETVQSSCRDWFGDANESKQVSSPGRVSKLCTPFPFSGPVVAVVDGSKAFADFEDCGADARLPVEDLLRSEVDLSPGRLAAICFPPGRLPVAVLE